jgi:hypothetical protein
MQKVAPDDAKPAHDDGLLCDHAPLLLSIDRDTQLSPQGRLLSKAAALSELLCPSNGSEGRRRVATWKIVTEIEHRNRSDTRDVLTPSRSRLAVAGAYVEKDGVEALPSKPPKCIGQTADLNHFDRSHEGCDRSHEPGQLAKALAYQKKTKGQLILFRPPAWLTCGL